MQKQEPAWRRVALIIEAALILSLTIAAVAERPLRWLIGLF